MGVTVYAVTAGTKAEIEAIREAKPPHLLLSYFYFRQKPLAEFVDAIGYAPKIMLDSGAFSAANTGKNLSPLDYMRYLDENLPYLESYISLDVMGDPWMTRMYYDIFRGKGYRPVPVYHIGDSEQWLQWYLDEGADLIALGGTVRIADKKKVAKWVKDLIARYPQVDFHLLGSSSSHIREIEGLRSCDASTWIHQAMFGVPRSIKGKSREAKIQRMIYHLRQLKETSG